jgi:hypothetical protein
MEPQRGRYYPKPEDVLDEQEYKLWERVQRGEICAPRGECDQPLRGQLYFWLRDGYQVKGILLFWVGCGFR